MRREHLLEEFGEELLDEGLSLLLVKLARVVGVELLEVLLDLSIRVAHAEILDEGNGLWQA